jgi:hypothetical protein
VILVMPRGGPGIHAWQRCKRKDADGRV